MEKKKKILMPNISTIKVRILDKHVEDLYDELKALPEYSKTMSALYNDAIRVGIPLLHKEIFGEVEIKDDGMESKFYDKPIDNETLLQRIIDLLQEVNTNMVLTKSAMFSMFNLYKNILNNKILKEKFSEGELSDTPDYLKEYEEYVIGEMSE